MSTQATPDLMPSLTEEPAPSQRAHVLMLHGGADRGLSPVDESSLSWRRSRVMMRAIRDDLHAAHVGVSLLRYRVKGWNAAHGLPSPVPDARWALDHLAARHPGQPVVLLGHSMGGRTAAAVADHPAVVGVVGLAPWLPPGEPVSRLRGKRLVAAHGRRDRITSPRATRAFVERARAAGCEASYVDMGGTGHYLLWRAGRWNRVATDAVLDLLG